MRTVILAALLSTVTAHSSDGQQPDPQPKPDVELLQGKWLILGLETGGKAEPDRNYKGNSLVFAKDKATLKESQFPDLDFTFTLDPTKSPKTIDLAMKNATIHGIYKLEGDDLTLCVSIGGVRPTVFATKGGGDTELFTLKRNRWETYTDRAFGYIVEMPGKPEERKRAITTSAGEVTTTCQVVRHEAERISYFVSVTPLPGKLDASETAAALDAARDRMLVEVDRDAKATMEGEKPCTIGKGTITGRELTIGLEVPNSKVKEVVRLRLFATNDRAYCLAIAGTEESVKAADGAVGRFWRSFSPNPPKKKG